MDQIRAVVELVGDGALGVHLHGSAVLDGLLAISGSRAVELTAVAQPEVRPWRYPPTADFQYGEWLRDAFESGTIPMPEPMPDLALLITMALAGNRPLSGPPLAELLDPVPHADVVRASVAGVPGLLDDLDHDTRNVVLTLARVWTTVASGEIRSKAGAADWALARLPPEHRPVLAHAKELYLSCRYDEETWSDELRAQVWDHARHVVAEVGRLSGR